MPNRRGARTRPRTASAPRSGSAISGHMKNETPMSHHSGIRPTMANACQPRGSTYSRGTRMSMASAGTLKHAAPADSRSASRSGHVSASTVRRTGRAMSRRQASSARTRWRPCEKRIGLPRTLCWPATSTDPSASADTSTSSPRARIARATSPARLGRERLVAHPGGRRPQPQDVEGEVALHPADAGAPRAELLEVRGVAR